MRGKSLYRTLAVIFVTGFFTAGCATEHAKFKEPYEKNWESTVLRMQLQSAEQQYKAGDFDKCRQSLAKLMVRDTPFAPLYLLAARVDLEGGNLDRVQANLAKAIEYAPEDPEAYYLSGVVYQRWQKLDKARDYYLIASRKKPSEALYVLATAEMQIAMGELEDARTMLEDSLPAFEQSAAMRLALGKIAGLQGDPDTAVNQYREATLLRPEDRNIRWSYAQALFDAGRFSDSAKILEDLRKHPPTMPKARDGLTRGADSAIEEAAALSIKVSLVMMLGECYLGMNRSLDARDAFQEVVRLQPENTSAYLALGKTCLLTGDLNLTQAAAQRVLRSEPSNVPAMILRATVLHKQKKWADALETLAAAARIAPDDPTVMCLQGISEMNLGRPQQAAVHFERAHAANPADPLASELLAQVRPASARTDAAPAAPEITDATPKILGAQEQ